MNREVQEIKLRVNIDRPTYDGKVRDAAGILENGNRVRMRMQFRGRELAHVELGMELGEMKRTLAKLAMVEQEPTMVGKSVLMTLVPLPKGPAL